jgi:site-specific recombinase XerD
MLSRVSRERFLSDSELARFMAAVRERRHVHQPRDHALFALLANTGIRPSEAMRLTLADVHLGRRVWIHVARRRREHAPHPVTDLVLQRAVGDIVKKYVGQIGTDPGARLFPFTKRQSHRLFHYYATKAGIRDPHKLYDLRHTVGMRLWRHTKDLRLMQAIMGHVRLKATACYVHTGDEQIRAAYDRLATIE